MNTAERVIAELRERERRDDYAARNVVVLPRSRRDRRRGPRTWQILAGCIALIAVLTALARLLR